MDKILLAKELLGLTIKPDVIDGCKDDSKTEGGKKPHQEKDMHVGFGTLRELQSRRQRDLAT